MKRPARIALARVTIEATTPLTIGTGRGDDLIDSVCVTDANGLPTIPGSSLAGILRHALKGGPDGAEARRLFGYQEEDKGSPSAVKLSWAQVHDGNDTPVPLRSDVDRQALSARERALLTLLETGVVRDHARLNDRGAVDDAGKFDERLVPRGARFTFELRVEGETAQRDLDTLLGVLASSTLRVGGRTRRGYGAFRLIRVRARTFDLTKDLREWAKLPKDLGATVHEQVLPNRALGTIKAVEAEGVRPGVLVIEPQDYWLFGNGDATRAAHKRGERAVDMLPKTEPIIVWADVGHVATIFEGESARNLVQSSGIKGALRHRATFHLRRATGAWADDDAVFDAAPIEALFGVEKRDARRNDAPGRVHLGDAWLTTATGASSSSPRDGFLEHVSIDRFTGAPMDGMLFSEAPLHGGSFCVEMLVETERVPEAARVALRDALDDLLQGRLAIGGGGARGHGFVKGRLDGPALQSWLRKGGQRGT